MAGDVFLVIFKIVKSHFRLLAPLLFSSAALAQQIGNPTSQLGVTPPRGVYAIRNAHIVPVARARD
jgi:hypothetical protein